MINSQPGEATAWVEVTIPKAGGLSVYVKPPLTDTVSPHKLRIEATGLTEVSAADKIRRFVAELIVETGIR